MDLSARGAVVASILDVFRGYKDIVFWMVYSELPFYEGK